MICPQCNAVYRDGFVRCADCGVELVPVLPGAMIVPQRAANDSPDNEEDPFCEFWRGEDPRVHAELCGLLSESGIPYRTAELQDHLFNRIRFPEFRIAIPFSKFETAEKMVAEAYGSEEAADSVMHPTEENRPEFRRLLELPLKEKFPNVKPEDMPKGWGDTWKRDYFDSTAEEKPEDDEMSGDDR